MKQVLLVVLALCTVACKGVGNGSRPEALRFVKSNADLSTLSTLAVYQCFTESPVLIADFTDGSRALFTSRVKYTSSNPAVVQVSNFDISEPGAALTDGRFYPPGTLFPVSNGTATITAEFAGLTTTLDVTVSSPSSITVSNEQYTDIDWVTQRDVIQMVPGTFQRLSAVATLGSNLTTVTGAGTWSSVDVDSDTATKSETAIVGKATGVVTASKKTDDGLQRATIEFAPCSGKPYTAAGVSFPAAPSQPSGASFVYSAVYEVAEPIGPLLLLTEKDIVSGRDYPKDGESMISGTQQFLRVMAEFGSPVTSRQDLTFKGVSIAIGMSGAGSTTDTLSYGVSPALLRAVSAVDAPAVSVTASFDPDTTATVTGDEYTSAALMLGVKAGTLDGATIPATPAVTPLLTPTAASIRHFDANLDSSDYSQRYAAVGCFTVGGVACSEQWPINHDVSWSISTGLGDLSVATISNAPSNAGTATSTISAPAQIETLTVTAKSIGLVKATTTDAIPTGTAGLKICMTGNSC